MDNKMRIKILRAASQHKTGTSFYRNCTPSIDYREALSAVKAVKKIRLTEEEAESPDLLWHLCQGYGIEPDWPLTAKNGNSWQDAGRIIYREWPENTSRRRRWEVEEVLRRFGFTKIRLLIAKLDRERWITWERIADLDQIGLNPAFLKNGLPE